MDGPLRTGHRVVVIALIAMHVSFVLLYTLPARIVPLQVRSLAIAYCRPLFHQQWLLFAPDPPLCSAELVVIDLDGTRHQLPVHHHYLEERIARTLAFHLHGAAAAGDTALPPELEQPIRRYWYARHDDAPAVVALIEECATDVAHPERREERVTEFDLVGP